MDSVSNSLYYAKKDKIEDKNKILERNAVLYPIAKAFFEHHHDYDDIINTFDYSIDSFKNIINKNNAVEETLQINNSADYLEYKIWFDNVRIYQPDSAEAYEFSAIGWCPTPNDALAKQATYSAVIVSDAHVLLYTFNKNDKTNKKLLCDEIIIPNGYKFNMPIPIYSKYCSLRHYDYNTLIKSGEEMEAMYGYFIISGKIRFIQPAYKKPFNSPLIYRNQYDNQLARTEVLYTKGFDYEDSYYIVAALINDKSKNIGRGGATASIPDYIFSLQMNDKIMNRLITLADSPAAHKKELINCVPIRYLFYAFNCKNDLEILKHICPSLDDFALIHSVRNSCLQGHKHKEALNIANINYSVKNNIIQIDEPLDQNLALYIIGQNILTKEYKDNITKDTPKLYRTKIISTTRELLTKKFMPAIGSDTNIDRNSAVCVELGNIVRRLYLIGFQLEQSQSKVALPNRRIRIGQQVEHEFKSFHSARLRDDVQKRIRETVSKNNKEEIVKHLQAQLSICFTVMSSGVSNSIQKSFKDVDQQSKLKTNMITPKNINFIHGSLREIVINTDNKASDVQWEHRDVHQSELFFICPAQTPEAGAQAGRFKMPGVYTFITLATTTEKEINFLQKHRFYKSTFSEPNMYYIKCNGTIVGYCKPFEEIEQLYSDLLEARRKHVINDTTTIVLNHATNILSVWCDIGRLVTYFVNVSKCFEVYTSEKNGKTTVTTKLRKEFRQYLNDCAGKIDQFNKGVEAGFLDLFDSEMTTYNALVAPCVKEFYENPMLYTHIALPNAAHGIVAGCVPAINMSKGVRVAYITNHTKQAIGPNLRYPQLKYQNDSMILIAPQIPLVKTCVYNYKGTGETPYGQNVTIAFMIYKYNQQDSIIVNRASAESGNFLEIDNEFTKMDKIDQDQEFCVPTFTGCSLNGNSDGYTKLDQNTALAKRVGIRFYQGDPLIGKITKTPNTNNVTDHSVLNNKPDGRTPRQANLKAVRSVVKNYIHDNDKGSKIASFGQFCVPIVGDKVNTECCQKGTIGKILDPSEMPYTSTGLRPDVIFNPPSVFRRETYGQIYLAMVMKVASLLGCSIDCTPYHTQRSTEEIQELAKKLGIDDKGLEDFYDPDTGRKYRGRIFVGIHYYERQPHFVDKKLNIRNGGPRDPITRIPTKGLKKGGGQSIDRMGSDSMISSGIHAIHIDEVLNRSAKIKIGVCKHCHNFGAYYDKRKNAWCCQHCGYHPDIVVKEVPHASNIIRQIFQALHVAIDYYEDGDEQNGYNNFLKK